MATILVVEDEAPIQQFIGEFLREEGYRIMCASHGAQALGLIVGRPPDLVVTDLMMPIMNGIELIRRLKSEPATHEVPVVMMSAAGRDQARQSGADAFLSKPFDLTDLLDLVARYIGPPSEEPEARSQSL